MESFDFEHWHAWDEVIAVNEVRSVGAIVTAVGYWTNTVQEDGRNSMIFRAGSALICCPMATADSQSPAKLLREYEIEAPHSRRFHSVPKEENLSLVTEKLTPMPNEVSGWEISA